MAESTTVPNTPAAKSEHQFVRAIGLFDGTMIVVGSMIGSGIFIVAADICTADGFGRRVAADLDPHGAADDCRGAFVWRIGGTVSACGRAVRLFAGSVFAAVGLSVRLDAVPGDSDRNDRGCGHWLCALSRRAVSRHFAEDVDYSADQLFFEFAISLSVQQLVAVVMIVFLTFLNTRGVRLGKWIQNIFTSAKMLSLLGLIVLCVFVARNATAIADNFSHLWAIRGRATHRAGRGQFSARHCCLR